MKKNDSGMTLVEVLVSMVIVFIFFLGINAAGIVVVNENNKNDQRNEAVDIAEQTMLAMRNSPYDNLASFNSMPDQNVVRKIRGRDKQYTISRTANSLGDLTELSVTVTWIRREKGPKMAGVADNPVRQYSHVLNTIVRR